MATEKSHGHLEEDEEPTCMEKINANWVAFKMFMWNSEQKAFMGRNARSWAEIGVFYLFYYGFLAAFFGSLLAIFYYGFIDQNEPTYKDKLGTPGLAHRPRYKNEENIAFSIDNENTYNKFVQDIDELLSAYKGMNESVYEDCASGPRHDDKSQVLCEFNLSELGAFCNTSKYGYDIGQPCLYFSLNKVWGWKPESYNEESISDRWADRWEPNHILFECIGRKDKDKANIGELEFYPAAGIDFKYFPYVGTTDPNSHYRKSYMTPLVAMRFKNITKDATVRMDCYARAANMEYGEFEGHAEFMVRVNSGVVPLVPEAEPTAEPTAAPATQAQATEARATTAQAQASAAAAQASSGSPQPSVALPKTTVTVASAAGPTSSK